MDINNRILKLEYEYFNNMKCDCLENLSYYCYINGDYYKSYLYSNKTNSKSIAVVYNILSLIRLNYKNIAYLKFKSNINELVNLYNEINCFGLNANMIKLHIIQIFIVFENDSLAKFIQTPLTKEEKIYYFLYKENHSTNLINNIADYNEEWIKNIILNNIKKHTNNRIHIKVNNKDLNTLEKEIIDLKYKSYDFYSFNYKDSDIEIISYKTKNNMSSMHILRFKDSYIIIDCGAYIDELGYKVDIDVENFFKKNHVKKSHIKGIFITHSHLDHYGSLYKLKDYEIFMTKETYELINYTNKITEDSYINLEEYDITFVKYNKDYQIGDLSIIPIQNGHILGSCGYLIDIKSINKKVLFTGDFCLNDQNIIKGMNLSLCMDIDYLVTETTYGSKKYSFTYEDRLKFLIEVINTSLNNSTPVFIPSFSIGRTQEILSLLSYNFPNKKILIDGASIGATKIYNKYFPQIFDSDNIEYGANDLDVSDKIKLFDIIICSSGMLQNGTKSKTYLDIIKNSNQPYTVIKSGFINKNSLVYEELNFFDGILFNFFDIGISAHATYNQLLYLINSINPKKIIMVHGKGIRL